MAWLSFIELDKAVVRVISLVSFPFLTRIAGSLQSWDRRVRPRLVWSNGTPLASRVVHRVSGPLSNCVWNLQVFPDDARGVSDPSFLSSSTGLPSKRCPGVRFLSRVDREFGIFQHMAPNTSQHLGCHLLASGVPPLSTWGSSSQYLGCLLSASSHYSHTKHTSVPLAKLVCSAHVDYDKQMQFTLLTCRGQQHLQGT